MVEISRRHVIAGAAATAAVAAMPGAPIAEVADPSAAVVVPYSEISIGQTLQI
jgi:TAT (twin-arginine translocation) pathway signal sequence